MTKKYYWVMAVIAAFVAGTMMTGTFAQAAPNNDDENGLVDAVLQIAEILDNLEQIPGPQGEQGPQGETGGVLGFYVVSHSITATSDGSLNLPVGCDAFDRALSAMTDVGFNTGVIVQHTGITSDPTIALAIFNNVEVGDTLEISAVCADFAPAHVDP